MKTGRLLRLSLALLAVSAQAGIAQWTQVNGPAGDIMFLSTYESQVYAQSNTGFFFSTDYGLSWTEANAELANSLVGTFPTDTVNYLLNNYLAQLPPLPDTIRQLQIANLELSSLYSLMTSLSIMYPETYLDSILVSLDSGATAMKVSEIMTRLALYAAGIDTNDILSKIDSAQMWFSTIAGPQWVSVSEIVSGIEVRAIQKTDRFVFVGTDRGVFRAATERGSWGSVNVGLADSNVHALVMIDTMLFAGTNGGVFVSTDDGITWKAMNTGLTNKVVYALAVSGDILFAGTHGGGVFASMNHGSSWRAVNTGLTSLYVNALAVSGVRLFAGTSGAGLWKRPVFEMITPVHEPPAQMPMTFKLMQNYPNPFNPTTDIEFRIADFGFVSLKVYNVLGQEVASLVNGLKRPGSYTVRFDGSGLPSGVYFYRLQAGSHSDMKKLMLMK